MEFGIPPEARILQEQFLAEQAEEATRRALEKRGFSKREFKKNNLRGPVSYKKIEQFATQNGWVVESGNGRHGIHLVNPNTGARQPLPTHGGRDLATGTGRGIVTRIAASPAVRN